MDGTTYVAELYTDERGVDRIAVWGPFPTAEASEEWAETPGGVADTALLWWSVAILDPSLRGVA